MGVGLWVLCGLEVELPIPPLGIAIQRWYTSSLGLKFDALLGLFGFQCMFPCDFLLFLDA